MKNIRTAIRLIAVQLGLATSVALRSDPVAGREGHPITRSRLPRWTAVLALVIALLPGTAPAQEDDTLTISSTFYMDSLSGTVGPDLAEVYANGHEHTWTLTLHGTTHSHSTFWAFGVKRVTEIHATSFDLEFFGPDAATLNGIVSDHIAEGDVFIYLENAYSSGFGDDFAIMHVWLSGPDMYFYSGHDMGVFTLFPTDADGYPVVGPEPFSIESDYSELNDMRPGNDGSIESRYSLVTFEGSVGPEDPPSLPTLSIGDASVVEGNRGFTQLQFSVSRSGSSEGTVSVDYRTVAGTARAKSDYTAASGTLIFQPGVWSQRITITVKSDRTREPDETFTVELFNTFGASVADAVATGTILNDD